MNLLSNRQINEDGNSTLNKVGVFLKKESFKVNNKTLILFLFLRFGFCMKEINR